MSSNTVMTFLWNPKDQEKGDGWFVEVTVDSIDVEDLEPLCADDCGECRYCKEGREPDQG